MYMIVAVSPKNVFGMIAQVAGPKTSCGPEKLSSLSHLDVSAYRHAVRLQLINHVGYRYLLIVFTVT